MADRMDSAYRNAGLAEPPGDENGPVVVPIGGRTTGQ